jgi:molybdopterin molybdotransferase
MLAALLHAGGAVVRTMAVVEDDVAAMRSSLRHAAIDADLVLTTAGISVGEEDYIRDALRDLGAELAVHKVAMKPGKPLAFGRFEDAVFIGPPGNPLAALAGAIGFVRQLLARRDTVPDFQSLAIRIVTQNSVMTSLLRRVLSGSAAVCTENPKSDARLVAMKSAQDGA